MFQTVFRRPLHCLQQLRLSLQVTFQRLHAAPRTWLVAGLAATLMPPALAQQPTETLASAARALPARQAMVEVRQLPAPVRQKLDQGRDALAGGRHEQALRAFDEALVLEPSNPYALSGRAMALHKLERHDQARLAYEQALAGGGDGFASLVNLAALTARQDPGGAVEQLRKAGPRKIPGGAQEAVAGYVLAEAGDLTAAAERFRQALRQMPSHPSLHANYAIVLDQLGRTAEAVAHYRQALAATDTAAWPPSYRNELRDRLSHLERAATEPNAGRGAPAPQGDGP